MSIKQAGLACYHPPAATEIHINAAFLCSAYGVQCSSHYLLAEVMWDTEDGSSTLFTAAIFPVKFEPVSHCLHSCQSNSVCSITSIRLGEFSTQLP